MNLPRKSAIGKREVLPLLEVSGFLANFCSYDELKYEQYHFFFFRSYIKIKEIKP
jgi:hypothetical protein